MTDADLEPSIGSTIKVFLPGESPWATVVHVAEPGRVVARLANHPVGILHRYKLGDAVTFDLVGLIALGRPVWNWRVSPSQIAMGPQAKLPERGPICAPA